MHRRQSRHSARRWAVKGDRNSAVRLGLPLSRIVVRRSRQAHDCQRRDHKAQHRRAEKMPGVRAILHSENIGKIFRSTLGQGIGTVSAIERRPPFDDDVVRYYGQYVALAVADSFESAKAAADAVAVTYAKEKPNVDLKLTAEDDPNEVMTRLRAVQSAYKASAAMPTGGLCERTCQARPDLRYAGRDARSHRVAGEQPRCGTATS